MTRINRLQIVAAIAAIVTITAAPAANAQTYYQSLTAFSAAATTTSLYTFEDIAPTNNFVQNPAVLVTPALGRVTFSITGGDAFSVFAMDSGAFAGQYDLSDGSDSVLSGAPTTSPSTTRISMDNLYTAFGIEYGMTNNATTSYTFTLFNGNTQVGAPFARSPIGGDNFIGVTSATAFNNVRVTSAINSAGQAIVFDNARTGSTAAMVPEAGSLALLLPAMGVLGAFVAVRRRK